MEYKTPIGAMEDLMREHGLLNRLLLIYEEIIARITTGKSFSQKMVYEAATMVRDFIEDYHEKMEEKHVFPRLRQAGIYQHIIDELLVQHKAGRVLTNNIRTISKKKLLRPEDTKKLGDLLQEFVFMYRAHESREDTEIFPQMHALLTPKEYEQLGEEFERTEHELLGKDGFEKMLKKVMRIEKSLGIFDLEHYTGAVRTRKK